MCRCGRCVFHRGQRAVTTTAPRSFPCADRRPCRRRPRPATRPRPTQSTRLRSRRKGTNTSSAAASRAPPSATRPPSTCGVCRFHRLLPRLLVHPHHRQPLCTSLGCCLCFDLRLRLQRHHCRCRLNTGRGVPAAHTHACPVAVLYGSGAQGEGGALCQPQRGAAEAGTRNARHLLLLTTY